MANEYEIFEFLEAENAARSSEKMKRKKRREQYDPFSIGETEFVRRYRLTQDLVRMLCDELRPNMRNPTKTTDLSVETKVLTALSFYATGSYQRSTGHIKGHFMAQQTVSSVIAEVTACLNSQHIRQKYIVFPANDRDRNRVKTEFYNKFKIPGILGCIDCTHVAIVRPTINEERYYCGKHYHSLNVQLICDANMQILSVDASHGGAAHDSAIWASHPLRAHLEEISNAENIWFLGDSGYPLRRTMMVPILDAAQDTPEAHYTNMHICGRNIIGHTIGLLKARFRCLLAHRVLHYSPETAGSIVNACVILHNICNRANTPVQQISDEEVLQEAQLQLTHHDEVENRCSNNIALDQGWTMRNALVHQLWERRHI